MQIESEIITVNHQRYFGCFSPPQDNYKACILETFSVSQRYARLGDLEDTFLVEIIQGADLFFFVHESHRLSDEEFCLIHIILKDIVQFLVASASLSLIGAWWVIGYWTNAWSRTLGI